MAEEALLQTGLYLDELNKLRVIEPEAAHQTSELKDECKEFLDKTSEFQKNSDIFINLIDKLAKDVEQSKMQAIGSRNLLKSISKEKEAQQQQLIAVITEKKLQLERIKVSLDSDNNIPLVYEPDCGGGEIMSGDHKTVIRGNPSQYVKLNIGGSLHYTTIGTLTKHDSMLRAMFSGRMEVLTDSEGWILIDRCGRHFGTILNFLRDGTVPLPDNPCEIGQLLQEAKYYLVQELVEACEIALKKREKEVQPICRVPLITSIREEQSLIGSTSKPVVKLLINRHNNKYSYTSTSDDNLLKNIELFDKLSLRFSGRVLFIKDVIGSNEICCWSFYGHGKKIAEVCCTSIVYATDKKHTKVEFPEARIYEETLNILLYENRNGPDMELMQATSTRGAVAMTTYTSDDEEERRTTSCQREVREAPHLGRLRSNKHQL